MKLVLNLLLGLFLVGCSGCASLIARTESHGVIDFHEDGIYPATRLDVLMVPFKEPGIGMLFLLDLPISFTLDTLLLPYDIYHGEQLSGARGD